MCLVYMCSMLKACGGMTCVPCVHVKGLWWYNVCALCSMLKVCGGMTCVLCTCVVC